MYLPLNYDKINIIEGTHIPSTQKTCNNLTFDYWVRTLFHRASSTLIFDLPEYWQGPISDFWYYCLLKYGVVSIQDLTDKDEDGEKIGMCFSPVGLTGYNFYYQYTTAILSNPILNSSKELKINKDCALVKLTPDFMGIWDVLYRYAEQLSNLDNAINMSIINNKLAYILGSKTKAGVQALKKMMDKINSGEPTVFLDSRLLDDQQSKTEPFQMLQRDNLKQSYLTTDQLLDLHTILNDFDAEVGIPTVPYQKKERETEYESKSKVADGLARSLVWERCINESLIDVEKLYPGLGIKFRLRWEVPENVTNETDNDRNGVIS